MPLPTSWRPMGTVLAVASLLALHTALAVLSLVRENPTIDEVAHLPAGVTYWQQGTFRLYPHNPPLIKLAAAGVKAREGSPSGHQRHLQRANELLGKARQDFGGRFMGLDLDAILSAIGEADFEVLPRRESAPEVVFEFNLVPEQTA